MKTTNLIAAATVALGLFACDRNADRSNQTNTTSAAVPAENAGTTTQAPLSPAGADTSANAGAKDAGHVGITTTTGSDTANANANGKANGNANANGGGHRGGAGTQPH